MTKPVDSKDVWIKDRDILRDYDSMTNDKIAVGTRTLDNNVKTMKRESTTLVQKSKALLFILNEAIGSRSRTNKCHISSIMFYKCSIYFQKMRIRKFKVPQKYIQMEDHSGSK